MSWDDIIKGLRDEPKRRKPKHKVDLRQKHKQKLSTKGKVKETEEKKCPPGERWDDELEEIAPTSSADYLDSLFKGGVLGVSKQ